MAAFAFASAISLLAAAPVCDRRRRVAEPVHGRAGAARRASGPGARRQLFVAPAEESALWRQARRYRANDGSMLAAAARRPALVVTMGSAGRDQARLAAAVGARLLVLPYPASLTDVAASVRSVGRATGNVRRAEAIVRRCDRRPPTCRAPPWTRCGSTARAGRCRRRASPRRGCGSPGWRSVL
jgi:hypothetical protein